MLCVSSPGPVGMRVRPSVPSPPRRNSSTIPVHMLDIHPSARSLACRDFMLAGHAWQDIPPPFHQPILYTQIKVCFFPIAPAWGARGPTQHTLYNLQFKLTGLTARESSLAEVVTRALACPCSTKIVCGRCTFSSFSTPSSAYRLLPTARCM